MKKYTLIFTIIFFAFIACNNDDENPPIEPDNHPIVGKWSLVQLTGGWNPQNDFNVGEIVWEFRIDNTMNITIQEGVETSPADVFTPSAYGTNYTYNIEGNMEGTLILTSDNYPNNPNEIPFIIESDSLHFPLDESSDGMSYHFVRLDE